VVEKAEVVVVVLSNNEVETAAEMRMFRNIIFLVCSIVVLLLCSIVVIEIL